MDKQRHLWKGCSFPKPSFFHIYLQGLLLAWICGWNIKKWCDKQTNKHIKLSHCRTNKHQIEILMNFQIKNRKISTFLTGLPTFLIFTSFLSSFFRANKNHRESFWGKKSHLGTKKQTFSSGCLKWMMNNKQFYMEHGWRSPFLSIHSKNWLFEVPGWPWTLQKPFQTFMKVRGVVFFSGGWDIHVTLGENMTEFFVFDWYMIPDPSLRLKE